MHPYQRLAVWERARSLTIAAYRLTRDYPREELFGLSAQVRRAAISVGANIVEGTKRRSARDFAHFLNIAEGSAAETAYLIGVAAELGYGDAADSAPLVAECNEIERMICSLRKRVLQGPHRT